MSGYAIQQRTLRDLRSAIKPRQPRPRPQPLPKFHLPEQFRKTKTLEDGTIIDIEDQKEVESERVEEVVVTREEPVVEIPQTEPEPEIEQEPLPVHDEKPSKGEDGDASRAQIAMMEALQSQVAQKSWAVEHPDPLAKSKVPISRAQRRQLIKDEIHRLSTGNEKVYYQRRLW